jgi:hypothetical protein
MGEYKMERRPWGTASSGDGSVITGLAYSNPDGVQGFRYDVKSGTVSLGTLDAHVEDLGAIKRDEGGSGISPGPTNSIVDISIALGVSDDGNVVIGTSGYHPPTDAFIWTPSIEILKLSDYLTSKGITGFEGWTLMTATDVNPDGKVIAGTGLNNVAGRVEGFVVRLP